MYFSNFCFVGIVSDIVANSSYGFRLLGTANEIDTILNIQHNQYGMSLGSSLFNTFNILHQVTSNEQQGMYIYNDSHSNIFYQIDSVSNNFTTAINFENSSKNKIYTLSNVSDNGQYGILFTYGSFGNIIGPATVTFAGNQIGIYNNYSSVDNYVTSVSTSGNTSSGLANYGKALYIDSATLSDSTQFSLPVAGSDKRIYINDYNSTGNVMIITDGGYITNATSTMTHGSGKQWKLNMLIDSFRTEAYSYPLTLPLAKIAVVANNLVTVSVWCTKAHATQIKAMLVCRGGQIAGVDNDVTSTKLDTTTEEQLTITFTPTEAGVIEIEAWAYYNGGTWLAAFDGLTITQA
jgi:hypothetical protein